MNEVYYYSEEIDGLLEDFKRILLNLKKSDDEIYLKKAIKDVNSINERIKTAKDAYFIEVKNARKEDQTKYISSIKGRISTLENLNIEFDFLKGKMESTFKERKRSNQQPTEKYLSPKELEIRGDIIQDKTQESIYRMKKMVDESEQITKDAAYKLDAQNEKLMEVNEKIDDVDVNISQARETVRDIAKGAIADRFVRMLFILVTIALIALIVVIAIPKPSE